MTRKPKKNYILTLKRPRGGGAAVGFSDIKFEAFKQ